MGSHWQSNSSKIFKGQGFTQPNTEKLTKRNCTFVKKSPTSLKAHVATFFPIKLVSFSDDRQRNPVSKKRWKEGFQFEHKAPWKLVLANWPQAPIRPFGLYQILRLLHPQSASSKTRRRRRSRSPINPQLAIVIKPSLLWVQLMYMTHSWKSSSEEEGKISS